MLVLPFAAPGAPLLHHDSSLYKQTQWTHGIGPKHLFDQFQEHEKQIISHPGENIGYLRVTAEDYRSLEPERGLVQGEFVRSTRGQRMKFEWNTDEIASLSATAVFRRPAPVSLVEAATAGRRPRPSR